MAWRPYENLINGELDNRIPGKVTGWIRFYRRGQRPLKVKLDLAGDFHEDIRGTLIRLTNDQPSERDATQEGNDTYMEGFASVQRGDVGDITAGLSLGPWTATLAQRLMARLESLWEESAVKGKERELLRRKVAEVHRQHIEAGDLYYPYVEYPYIEWYSERNGRVVLELDPSQVQIVNSQEAAQQGKTPRAPGPRRREWPSSLGAFLAESAPRVSEERLS